MIIIAFSCVFFHNTLWFVVDLKSKKRSLLLHAVNCASHLSGSLRIHFTLDNLISLVNFSWPTCLVQTYSQNVSWIAKTTARVTASAKPLAANAIKAGS